MFDFDDLMDHVIQIHVGHITDALLFNQKSKQTFDLGYSIKQILMYMYWKMYVKQVLHVIIRVVHFFFGNWSHFANKVYSNFIQFWVTLEVT